MITRLLVLTTLTHEWNNRADGTPKSAPETRSEYVSYLVRGVAWKLTHPVTALCSLDGETRPWLKSLARRWYQVTRRA